MKMLIALSTVCLAVSVLRGDERPLPEGYTRVEYIQGDGSTSDVVTDFVPNPQTDKIVCEIEMTDTSHNMFVFSARRGGSDAAWSLNLLFSTTPVGYRFDYANAQYKATQAFEIGTRYEFVVDRNVLTRTPGQTLTATEVPTFIAAGGPLHLFMTAGNPASVGNFKLYSFKIYRNDVIIHDLVPAVDEDGFPQLVDVVGELSVRMSGTFFTTAEPPDTEQRLKREIVTMYNEVNPVVSGSRKYIALACITDTHKCKRVAGDDDPTNPVKDYWYHDDAGNPLLVDPEPSIRLLGKVAAKAGFDALIHAGDFSTAIPIRPFDEGDYLKEIRNVKAMVSEHLPGTPFFAVDGNHDREYWNAGHTSGHSMTDAEWAAALAEINTDVSKVPLIDCHAGIGNNYVLDFKRCLATGGRNVRMLMVSIYDKDVSSDLASRIVEGVSFPDPAVAPGNTIFGITAHDHRDAFVTAAKSCQRKFASAGFFGTICGDRHRSSTTRIEGTFSDYVCVKNAFSTFGDTTRAAYHFSIFVFDTDANVVHEICLSGVGDNAPKLVDHPIDGVVSWEHADGGEIVAIRGDGSSHIETDYVPHPQTDKIVVTLELPTIQNSQYAFAARQDGSDNTTAYALNLRSNGYRFDYKKSGTAVGALKTDVKYTFTAENNVMTWSGGASTTCEKDETFTAAGGPLWLFASKGMAAAAVGNFLVYSLQVYRSGRMIHDLQPQLNGDGSAMLVDKIKNGEAMKLTTVGSGSFIPVMGLNPDPRPPRKAKRLEWIQGDGVTGYFETDFIPDPSRDKMEAVVTLMDADVNQFVFSARDGKSDVRPNGAWSLQLRGQDQEKNMRYDFNQVGAGAVRELKAGVKYVFTAERNVLSWSHGEGISETDDPSFTQTSGPLLIFWAVGNPVYSSMRLHSFRIWRDGVLIHEFLPTRLPSGTLRLMDYGPNPVLVTGHGLFGAGPEKQRGFMLLVK